MSTSQKVCNVFSALCSAVLWCAAVSVGVVEHSQDDIMGNIRNVIFVNDSHYLLEKWRITISPPQWSMCVWEFEYTWNTLWVVYAVVSSCTTVKPGKLGLSTQAVVVFPTSFHLLWMVSSLAHVGTMFFWDRESLIAAMFFQIFVILASSGALYLSYTSVHRHGALLHHYHPWLLWVCRTLVHNGITMHVVWNIVLLGNNFIAVMFSEAAPINNILPIVVLCFLAGFLLVYFIIDVCVLDQWMRYTFSIYPIMIWSMGAVLINIFETWSLETILCVTIVCMSAFFVVIKVPVVVWRSFSAPLYNEHTLPHVIVNKNASMPRYKVKTERRRIDCVY